MFYMKKLKALLISVGISVALGILLLALTALALGKAGILPKEIIPVITTLIGCAAVFSGALCASIYAKENGILLGLFTGIACSICMAVVSVLVFKNDFNIASAGKLAAFLLSGAIGGILGVNRKSKVKF